MFCLPAIGVSACTRTIGHATSSRISEASLHIMRARMTAAMRQPPSSAACVPRDLSRQVLRPPYILHDSVRGHAPLPGMRLGPRHAMYDPVAGFAGFAQGREIDSPAPAGEGERFCFGGVKCKVSEVPHP